MAVQFIQASVLKKSKDPIPLVEGYHLKKIRKYYYLIKTTTIDINYKHKTNEKTDHETT